MPKSFFEIFIFIGSVFLFVLYRARDFPLPPLTPLTFYIYLRECRGDGRCNAYLQYTRQTDI